MRARDALRNGLASFRTRVARKREDASPISCAFIALSVYSAAVIIAVIIFLLLPNRQWPLTRKVVFYAFHGVNRSDNSHLSVGEGSLTLFTTCGDDIEHTKMCKKTIVNWATVLKGANLILFDSNPKLSEFAKAYGWIIHAVPFALHGLPVLKDMFIKAQELCDTRFYAYANEDIFFSDNLLVTLQGITNYKFHGIHGMLAVGRRIDYSMTLDETMNNKSDAAIDSAFDSNHVSYLAQNGKLFQANAQDYFIATKDAFTWAELPDFVVGRVGYDNWLLTRAILDEIVVIDVTETVTAIHTTHWSHSQAAHTNLADNDEDPNSFINLKLAGSDFHYGLGQTLCSDMMTVWNGNKVLLEPRKKWTPECVSGFLHWSKLPMALSWLSRDIHSDSLSEPVSIRYDAVNITDLLDNDISIL